MGKIDGQLDERSLTLLGEARCALDAAKRELNGSPFVGQAARSIVSAWDALAREADAGESHELASGGSRSQLELELESKLELESWRESLARVRVLASGSDERERRDPVALLDLRDQVDWLSRAIVWSFSTRIPAVRASTQKNVIPCFGSAPLLVLAATRNASTA